MTEQDKEKIVDEFINESVDEFIRLYGPIPDPDQCPLQFNYLLKLYKYFHLNKGVINDENSR